jgi:hypothetical protein
MDQEMTIDQYDELAASYSAKEINEAAFRAKLKQAGLADDEIQKAVDLEASQKDSIGFKLDDKDQIVGFVFE